MMRSLLPLHRSLAYESVVWHKSGFAHANVRFAIRRPSLGQRIELTSRVRDLTMEHEFLKAGDLTEQLRASLSELLVRKLYLEWGLAEIHGLTIDGETASPASLIARGPEELVDEVINAIRAEAGLTEEERKNY